MRSHGKRKNWVVLYREAGVRKYHTVGLYSKLSKSQAQEKQAGRWLKNGPSLPLAQSVANGCSSIKRQDKAALTKKLKPLIEPPGFTGKTPGGPSRWSTKRSGEWVPLKPKLVVEVCYDHFTGDRFRHGIRILRWRPDKAPKQCSLDQVKQTKAKLMALLG